MQVQNFLNTIQESFNKSNFIKLNLGNYQGAEPALKQIIVKPVSIKNSLQYQFTFRNKTNDIVKNYIATEALEFLNNYLKNGFNIATLNTAEAETIWEILKNNKQRIRTLESKQNIEIETTHNKVKSTLIDAENAVYLNHLGITDASGKVYKNANDKFTQINHYLEILQVHLQKLEAGKEIQIADMGCGKGYLTFALYDFLKNNLQKNITVIGVESRADLVQSCNTIAQKNKFTNLKFEQNNIANYLAKTIDVLIALHACDTATDDAIAKGIKTQSQLIVVAPCCHKQIRKEITKNKVSNSLDFVTRHGILLERTAEMLTDSLRVLILEYFGYKTKLFEFVTNVHTPKNIMIIAEKNSTAAINKEQILQKINNAKSTFGINQHYLETLVL